MPELHNEQPSEPVEAKQEGETKPTLDSEKRAEQQMEAKLDLLEDALISAAERNPRLDIEGFYDNMMELVYGEEFPVNKIEEVVDALDRYPFSETGAQKFNDLVNESDAAYLCDLMTGNMRGLELAGMTDLPKADMDEIRRTVVDLGKLSVEVKHGPTYLGRMMYRMGTDSLAVSVLYGKPGVTQKGTAQKSGAVVQVDGSQEEEWMEAAKAGEPVNPFGTISEEYKERMADFAEDVDVEREEFQQEIADEYQAEYEKTGITPEEFMASKGMDLFGRPLDE